MKLRDYKHVHCIGIGGIGLSAIGRYCHAHGAKVSGSDISLSRITEDLEKEGITIYKGHHANNLPPEIDLVIYTIAATENNPELKEARARGCDEDPLIQTDVTLSVAKRLGPRSGVGKRVSQPADRVPTRL